MEGGKLRRRGERNKGKAKDRRKKRKKGWNERQEKTNNKKGDTRRI